MPTTYTNPVIPGFAPDPSVVCVDGLFYLVNSSFHIFPGLPVYVSRNLKEWTQIESIGLYDPKGNAIHKRTQLTLAESRVLSHQLDTEKLLVAVLGLSAPTIRYHNGVFYIICTNVWTEGDETRIQNFYVKTKDIWSGKWSEPIFYGWHGIDPSIFFDDDGQAYIQGHWLIDLKVQPSSYIKQAAIDLSTGTFLTGIREIWQGFARHDSEGPHMYKKDGYYYILLAEGGTFEHHMVTMARSKNIWGPFESCSSNPVLTADGKDEYIQNIGHADLFEDSYGSWWAVLHGVQSDGSERFPLSRETLLTPVSWPKGEFPTFSQPKMIMEISEPREILDLTPNLPPRSNCPEIVHIRDAILENYEYTKDGNRYDFSMVPSTSDLSTPNGTTSFMGIRQRRLACQVTTKLILGKVSIKYKAGITVYKDDYRHSELYFDSEESKLYLSVTNKPTSPMITRSCPIDDIKEGESLELQIRASELSYEFWFRSCDLSDQKGQWQKFGEVDTLEITARDFSGPIFGVFAVGQGQSRTTREWIDFKEFRVENLP